MKLQCNHERSERAENMSAMFTVLGKEIQIQENQIGKPADEKPRNGVIC